MRRSSMFTLCLFITGLAFTLPPPIGAEETGANGSPAPASGAASQSLNFFAHHIQFLGTEAGSRYRYIDKAPSKVTDRDLQYKISSRVRINLIGEGITFIQARGESGRSFTSSYDYTGVGPNKNYWSFNLKDLFLGQKIGPHLEAQAGGIEYDWGAGTEATYADNDAWLEGYRLRYLGAGRHGTPNEVSATVGYVGDFTQPNEFSRLHRMSDENYVQILAAKSFGKNIISSGEFDSLQSIRYMREAVRLQKLRLFVVDEFSVEAMTRLTDDRTLGWYSSVSRTLAPKGRLRLGFFCSDIPAEIFLKSQIVLQGKKKKTTNTTIFFNGDSYALGKRVGPTIRITPLKDLEISLFGSDRLDKTPGPRYRGQVVFRYQLAPLLNRMMRR